MDEQLNEAYELIKQGNTEQAIAILETYIRNNRNSDDGWWLYANAVEDPDQKRNALNNVLRIGTNPAREDKVQFMLAQLDDPFALPQQYSSPAKRGEKKSGMSMGVKVLIGMGILFGVCACVAVFGFGTLISKMLYVPSDYERMGNIEIGDTVAGTVDTTGDWDGYIYQGRAGEQLVVTVHADNSDFAPYILLYAPDDTLIDASDENASKRNRLRATLNSTGNYTILVRTFLGVGTGEYTMTVSGD